MASEAIRDPFPSPTRELVVYLEGVLVEHLLPLDDSCVVLLHLPGLLLSVLLGLHRDSDLLLKGRLGDLNPVSLELVYVLEQLGALRLVQIGGLG